ncbi:sortase [Enterococcus faecium]|uniref:sortase domain-containing protein n=1 Tax=Enterococcus faecium TaxID=1352 RepID=UPI0027E991A6|nr:sortase [Enterococcus faecalis]HAQ5747075.1 sortase [Enterococcus faecium]
MNTIITKRKRKLRERGLILFAVLLPTLSGLYLGYTQNYLNVKDTIVVKERAHMYVPLEEKRSITSERERIRNQIMKQTQLDNGLTKQGFISIPSLGILLPIFDKAYSEDSLKSGASSCNIIDPINHKISIPELGKGNYPLAGHNFNDGKTAFSALQQSVNNDYPYIINGESSSNENTWLVGTPVYVANGKNIFKFEIGTQYLVAQDDISVLEQTAESKLSMISCLYPSTNFRIITPAFLVATYDWINAPDNIINNFDLQIQQTNAYSEFYFKGIEEGSNGNSGGNN